MRHQLLYLFNKPRTLVYLGPLVSTEKQENEITLSDSPKVKVGSNGEDGGSSENKQASLSNGTEHDLIEPDMEKTVPESSENQLQKQISVEKG